jgi:putative Mg2+ transporter-C (MgtC) family protein
MGHASLLSNPSAFEMLQYFGPRLFFAVLCGGLVGLERELKNKPAGIKTNILICLGSCLFTIVSILIANTLDDVGKTGDPARIAAQIVPGIGFLGGGTIIQARGTILGLTTAATIWVVAAIGIMIGIGRFDVGLVLAVTVIAVLFLSSLFEDRVFGRAISFAVEAVTDDPQGQVRLAINQALAQNDLLLDDFTIQSRGEWIALQFRYTGHRANHKKFLLELWSTPGIREVRQI